MHNDLEMKTHHFRANISSIQTPNLIASSNAVNAQGENSVSAELTPRSVLQTK